MRARLLARGLADFFLHFFYKVKSTRNRCRLQDQFFRGGVDRAGRELRLFCCQGGFLVESTTVFSEVGRSPLGGQSGFVPSRLRKIGLGLLLMFAAIQLPARDKDNLQYGAGLIVNVPFSESEVTQVVQDVIQDGIIRGTKEYNKDQYVMGATAVSTTRVFSEKVENGRVFYKIRLNALDPRNFKDSGDSGTLAVRYIVQPQGADHTVLRIDARFMEDFRRVSHASNGSVENAEYKDIHDRLDSIELMKSETAEAEKENQAAREKMAASRQEAAPATQAPAAATTVAEVTPAPSVPTPAPPAASSATEPAPASIGSTSSSASPSPSGLAPASAPVAAASFDDSSQTLEEHVKDLRRQVQRLVKAPGAPLKSAPFHTASTLQSLAPGTEVLIVVSTPYWYGVETHDGQHGWMLRDDLGLLP